MTNQEAIEHLKAGRIDPEITAMCIAALAAQVSVKHADFTPLTTPQICPHCGVELEPNSVYPHVCEVKATNEHPALKHGDILHEWTDRQWAVIVLGSSPPEPWLHYKHIDGQWVSKRKLLPEEIEAIPKLGYASNLRKLFEELQPAKFTHCNQCGA